MNSLYKYQSFTEIQQKYKANEAKLSNEYLLETYTIK